MKKVKKIIVWIMIIVIIVVIISLIISISINKTFDPNPGKIVTPNIEEINTSDIIILF